MTVTPTILDGVLVSELADNGDGTGTRTHYASDGTVTSTEPVAGLPVPVPDPAEQIAELQATVDALLALIAGE